MSNHDNKTYKQQLLQTCTLEITNIKCPSNGSELTSYKFGLLVTMPPLSVQVNLMYKLHPLCE